MRDKRVLREVFMLWRTTRTYSTSKYNWDLLNKNKAVKSNCNILDFAVTLDKIKPNLLTVKNRITYQRK